MQKQREHWSTHLGFILAAAGSAIGLGTLWKFPYVTGQNGGGVFVLIYILCTFLIGIPVFMAELILGRKAQRGAVGIFDTLAHHSVIWKAAGWLGVISSFLIMSFYSVVAGWGLNYVLMSLNEFYVDRSAQDLETIFASLETAGDISLFWHFAFMALTVALVYPGVRHGIEYWSRFMTTGLLVMLVCLCAYSVTLDGFGQAVRFIFYPDLAKFKPSAALEALGLSFFTLSLGQGIMLTYGSYMRPTEDIPKTGFIIGFMIIIVSLLAGLMIFPIIFTFGFAPEAGPGLVFKTLPLLFSKLPGALIISTTFFTLFVFTALTSSVAMVEVITPRAGLDGPAPAARIIGPKTGLMDNSYSIPGIAVDSSKSIYVTLQSGRYDEINRVIVFAAGSNGDVAPRAVISGHHTMLSGPSDIKIGPYPGPS